MLCLNTFVNFVLNAYFLETRCVLIFADMNHFLDVHFSLPIISISVDSQGKFDHSMAFNYFGCQGFVIKNEAPLETIKEIEKAIRYDTMERFNARRYLVIATDDMDMDMENMNSMVTRNLNLISDVFDLEELEYIADFLLALHSEKREEELIKDYNITIASNTNCLIELYTHKFVGMHHVQEAVHLGTWQFDNDEMLFNSNSHSSMMNLYPDKLHNGQGRTFKIATFTYKPYSVPEVHEGTELQLAEEFSLHYNLTPYYVLDEEGEWGEIYDNWTGYGILGNVMNDNGDVGLGALYTWAHEYAFLDLSKPVVRTGITCLTPAPHLAAGWLVPLFSFTYEMWIAVGITFVVCSLVLTLLEYYDQDVDQKNSASLMAQNCVLDTASIFLLQAFNRFGHAGIAKNFLHGCMFLFSLLIASSYSSGLASSLTVPRYVGAIHTVQDLVDSGIQWGATSIAWIMSIMGAEEYNYQVLVERFLKTDGPRLSKYNNKRFAFSVERLPAGQFAIGDYITEEGAAVLQLMREDIYWEQCVLMTKKSSIWMPLIDDFILRLAQTGIPGVWEYRVATKHLNPKIQRAVQYAASHAEGRDGGPVKLQWGHVQGAFAILIIGNIIGAICFVVECLKKRKDERISRETFLE